MMEPCRKKNLQPIAIFLGLAVLYILITVDTLTRIQPENILRPLNHEELITLGRISRHQANFINGIRQDLKIKKAVVLIIGPAPAFPRGRIVESVFYYYIFIEESFFLSLTDMEQKALIGHEMGHIFFSPPICTDPIACQKGADFFATLYTPPQAFISVLGKISSNPEWQESEEYKVRMENLKNLQELSLLNR